MRGPSALRAWVLGPRWKGVSQAPSSIDHSSHDQWSTFSASRQPDRPNLRCNYVNTNSCYIAGPFYWCMNPDKATERASLSSSIDIEILLLHLLLMRKWHFARWRRATKQPALHTTAWNPRSSWQNPMNSACRSWCGAVQSGRFSTAFGLNLKLLADITWPRYLISNLALKPAPGKLSNSSRRRIMWSPIVRYAMTIILWSRLGIFCRARAFARWKVAEALQLRKAFATVRTILARKRKEILVIHSPLRDSP